jgi:hypothetical protein
MTADGGSLEGVLQAKRLNDDQVSRLKVLGVWKPCQHKNHLQHPQWHHEKVSENWMTNTSTSTTNAKRNRTERSMEDTPTSPITSNNNGRRWNHFESAVRVAKDQVYLPCSAVKRAYL